MQAACREEDPELFYDATEPGIAAAKAVCRHCPVWRECLDDAGDDPWAVWGGLSARDRRRRRTS
ncbi:MULTISPECIES: WhiB family transcriptional regulator [unclassified Streptomyces]|uniref:WhiB family transcriptional regulator n=1 Tax=unclassified Streptomyces TaxID=2593676 RepID=UPI0033E44008